MKKLILALVALFTITVSASAMSYEQAREQALFLTDKMAYELNLTDDQYEAAYEINLDYLMGVSNYNDLYGAYWTQRNLDLSYILLDWQYRSYLDALYFYRPLYWDGGYWHFRIYARYPHRDYYYFGRPVFYKVYHGGHSWRMNGGRSWYHGRTFGNRGNVRRIGMRDGFNRGNYGRGAKIKPQIYTQNSRTFGNRSFGTRSNKQIRQSSTRTTVNRGRSFGNRPNPSVDRRNNFESRPNGNTVNRSRVFGGPNTNSNFNRSIPRPNSSFGTRSYSPGRPSGNFGGPRGGFNGNHGSGGNHFGGHR